MMTVKAKKIILKTKKMKGDYGTEYHIFKNLPEELNVKEENIGQIVEIAGQKPSEFYKLISFDDKSALTVTSKGSFKAFRIESVAIQQDTRVRNKDISVTTSARKAISAQRAKNKAKRK